MSTDRGFLNPDAVRAVVAKIAEDRRARQASMLAAERHLEARNVASVVRRQIKPLSQLIDERLNAHRPIGVLVVNGGAALQFRLLRRRQRAARKQIVQHLGLRDHKAPKSEYLGFEEDISGFDICNPSVEIGGHSDISSKFNTPDANPAGPDAYTSK